MIKLVYIGPSLKGLPSGTVFADGSFPFHVREIIKEIPDVERLMVPVTGLQQARSAAKTRGTPLYGFVRNVLTKRK